jgi:hypothetical protein
MRKEIFSTNLYEILSQDETLTSCVMSVRNKVETIAASISRSVPSFTDHSIKHMDALWCVADEVISSDEFKRLSIGEAFILIMSFYFHDIGMALASYPKGLEKVVNSKPYTSFLCRLPDDLKENYECRATALSFAVRQLHAEAAMNLAVTPLQENEFVIESKKIRDEWGTIIGKISASHNWSLSKVRDEFGDSGQSPLPIGIGNLSYVAVLLRIIDYAHINRDRAPILDRSFRGRLPEDSLAHWLSQENIDGPTRQNNFLCYAASKGIENVDAWWLYHETLKGLNSEIISSKQFLDRMASSSGRFSLLGVCGINTQEEFSKLIKPEGFLPIEISIKTNSIEKLVKLLAGESLYGTDYMSPIRELIQNARDAVFLRSCLANTEYEKTISNIPIKITLDKPTLLFTIEDWGIGMDLQIINDYLLTLASSYWDDKFYEDFPEATSHFRPAGKFGIGFLSIFMLGDTITISTQRNSSPHYLLSLHGLSRRGFAKINDQLNEVGTKISVKLKSSVIDSITNICEKIRIYAPLIGHNITVIEDGIQESIDKNWVFDMGKEEFYSWSLSAMSSLFPTQRLVRSQTGCVYYHRPVPKDNCNILWPVSLPEYKTPSTRLICSELGVSILCSKGLTIRTISTPGFTGVINVDEVEVDTSRSNVIRFDLTEIIEAAKIGVREEIIANLEHIANTTMIVEKMDFLSRCVESYSSQCLKLSKTAWISLLKLPGSVDIIDSETFIKQASDISLIFICCGAGPWTAMKKWTKECSNYQDELAIVIDDSNSTIDYCRSDDPEVGTLLDIWPFVEKETLFIVLLELISEAWGIGIDTLLKQNNWSHQNSITWGYIKKPAAINN